jgi:ADP-heptose:LPS heptosyltransferase
MMLQPRRILIVLFGAIGDVTRALPILDRLRRAYPDSYLAWAVEPLAAPLLEGHPALDERIVFRREQGIRGFVRLLRLLRQRRFDLVLDMGRLLKTGVASWATRAPMRVGFHRSNSRELNWVLQTQEISPQLHFSSKQVQYERFGDHLGLPAAPAVFGLAPDAAERARASALLAHLPRPFGAFVLGSSCTSRRWFAARTAETVVALWERHGHAAVLLGTNGDRAFADAVRSAVRSPLGDLVGRTTLRELVAVLAEAAVTVTPDSGAMHIAAALGVPVVSLWGATSAARSAPHGWPQHVLTGRAPCSPCYLRRCAIGRLCMEAIRSDDVLDRIAVILGGEIPCAGPTASRGAAPP